MIKFLLVFAGGGAGAVARYLTGVATMKAFGFNWPYGTFAVNVLGGVAMGILVGWLALRGGADQERWRLLLGVGVLGGFTTFSSFSLETINLIDDKGWGQAATYVIASVVLAVGGVMAGRMIARALLA
jgi:CrcB protein